MINEAGSHPAAKYRLLRGAVVAVIAAVMLFTVWKIAPAAVFAADSTTMVVITGDEVNVRSGPGTNQDKLGKVSKGQSFKYITRTTNSSGNLWYKIQFTSSKAGWVSASYSELQTTASTAAANTATTTRAGNTETSAQTVLITGSEVNVRSGPGTNQDKLGKATKGQSFRYLTKTTNSSGNLWYKIQFTSSKAGWVSASYCQLITPDTDAASTATTTKAAAGSTKVVTITGSKVNVRSNAGPSYTKLGLASSGEKYTYLANKKGTDGKVWYKIQYTSSKVGWVISTYSKLDSVQADTTGVSSTTTTKSDTGSTTATTAGTGKKVVITGSKVFVRSNAGTSFSKIGSVLEGNQFNYLASKKDSKGVVWYNIQYTSSQTGWVVSTYSKIVTQTPTTTTTTRPVDRTGNVLVLYNSSAIRASAAVNSAVLATANRGQFLTSIGGKKDSDGTLWYNVKIDDTQTGWISSDQAQLRVGDNANLGINTSTKRCIERTVKVKKSNTRIFSDAGTSSKKIATLAYGQTFIVKDWKNDSDGVTWFAIDYNNTQAWISSQYVKITDNFTAPDEKMYNEKGTPIIYLSPSNQTRNRYAYGNTTEQKEMYRVAHELRDILESEYVCEVRIPPVSLPVTTSGRAYEAYLCGANFYLAIHSNAANKNNYGATAFYFPAGTQSKTFATNIIAEMKKIAPKKSTVSSPVKDGMAVFDNQGYSDIRNPGLYGIPSVLAEVEYHDNATAAQWIIKNPKPIARALANSLEKTLGLRKR